MLLMCIKKNDLSLEKNMYSKEIFYKKIHIQLF